MQAFAHGKKQRRTSDEERECNSRGSKANELHSLSPVLLIALAMKSMVAKGWLPFWRKALADIREIALVPLFSLFAQVRTASEIMGVLPGAHLVGNITPAQPLMIVQIRGLLSEIE
jgi:hypothetical protein